VVSREGHPIVTAKPKRVHAGLTSVLAPFALPQKEALRKDAHLYEALEAIEKWINTAAAAAGPAAGEILIVADTSLADRTVVLPKPTESIVNVKNYNGGVHNLHIDGGGLPIDEYTDGIDTHTNNQGFSFQFWKEGNRWIVIDTCFGGDEGAGGPPPEVPPPKVAGCLTTIPDGVTPTDIQSFREPGTWIKPSIGTWAVFTVISPGGAGAGGSSGSWRGTGDVGGGGGGGGGGKKTVAFKLVDLPVTLAIAPGKGGVHNTNRANRSTGHEDGYEGTDGDTATVGVTLIVVPGGKHGVAGTNFLIGAGGLGGDAGSADCNGGQGGDHGGTATGNGSLNGAPGGGAGGRVTDPVLGHQNGYAGGLTGTTSSGSGAAGGAGSYGTAANGGDGTPGVTGVDAKTPGGGGGGGGPCIPDPSSYPHGGDGGAGGWPGGGGGGGGAAADGFRNGGLGADGADGSVVVEVW